MTSSPERFDFPNGRGQVLAAALERPAGPPRAAALFAHCFTCSKDLRVVRLASRALRDEGLAVLRFDFTGLGNSEGDFANEDLQSNVADLVAAADALRERGLSPQLLIGHSFGGAAVLSAAAAIPEALAVAVIGAPSEAEHVSRLFSSSLDEIEAAGEALVRLGGREFRVSSSFVEDLREHRLLERVGELGRALLILHSPQDEIVGIDHARRLFEAARHPKSFVSLDGADHLLGRAEDASYAALVIAAWASRYIGRAASESLAEGGAVEELAEGEVLVRSLPGEAFAQEILAGPNRLLADEPVAAGGSDEGFDPYELLLASLGACTSMTLRLYADRKGWPLEAVEILLRHDRVHQEDCEDCVGGAGKAGRIDRLERVIRLGGELSSEQRERLLEIANRCPVHRTLLNEKRIPTKLA